jgi:hypothetical protein
MNALDSIYEKFYNTIDKSTFYQIISLDPTTKKENSEIKTLGNYSKWLLNAYRSNKIKDEDFYKITEALQKFDSNKKLNLLKKDKKDISRYSTLGDVIQENSRIVGSGKITHSGSNIITDRYHIINKGATIYFEDENWLIVIPNNPSSANFYSHNTQWCTKNPCTFYHYKSSGSLYIIINKNNTYEKFQMHRASNSFMDSNDRPVGKDKFLQKYKSTLPSFLFSKPTKEDTEVLEIKTSFFFKKLHDLPQSKFLRGIELGILPKENASVQSRLFKIEQEIKRKQPKKSRNKYSHLN